MGRIKIKVQPRSSRSRLAVEDGLVKVWVTASPTEGQANRAVCELLAGILKVPKSHVAVIRGETAREKTIDVDGLDDLEIVRRLIEQR